MVSEGMPLFGDPDPPSKRARKPKTEKSAAVMAIEAAYVDLFKGRWGFEPRRNFGADYKMFSALDSAWGRDEVVQLLHIYFSTKDTRVTSGDYSVRDFNRLAQYLRQRISRPQLDRRTAENVEAAQRAVGRIK